MLFFASVLASAAYLLILGRRLGFLFDDWGFLIDRPGWSAHSLLDPHNEHIVVLPVAIYKVLLATFGMDSAFPFRIVSTVIFLCSVVLLFVYLRRRVDDWLALAGAILILFLGAAYEDLLWSFQIGYFGSVAAGLGMLLALDRSDRTGDALACALLTLSVGFSSLGLPFAAGALVEIGSNRDRRQRAYVVGIPLLLYAAWWLGWGHTAQTDVSWAHFTQMPQYVADALAAGVSSLLGLSLVAPNGVFVPPGMHPIAISPPLDPLEWGRPLLILTGGLAAWRLHTFGRVPRQLWVVAAAAFTFWVLAALGRGGDTAIASRYQYISAVFILLLAAELLRGIQPRSSGWIVLTAATALIALSGADSLRSAYNSYRTTSEIARADLAALEIARGHLKRGFRLDESFAGTVIPVDADRYFNRIDEFGSPAYTRDELIASSEQAREAADRVLAAGLDLRLHPLQSFSGVGAPAPALVGPSAALLVKNTGCLTIQATDQNPPLLDLPAGGVVLKAGDMSHAQVRLRRFSSRALPVDLGTVSLGEIGQIPIPDDGSSETWKLSLEGDGPITVCGLGG